MGGKRTKLKKYTAIAVQLRVVDELAANNGNKQFFICVKTTSKKRVMELLHEAKSYTTLFHLNYYGGLWVNEDYTFEPPEDETIYFQNDHQRQFHFKEWLKLKDWLR